MGLWKKLYGTIYYGNSIYEEKNIVDYQKTKKKTLIYNGKKQR